MEAFEAIMGRQGVMRFRPTAVRPGEIERVLQAAAAAPSPANSQPWSFVVVTERALVRQVAEYLVHTQAEQVFRRLLAAPDEFTARMMELYDALGDVPCFVAICRHRRAELAPREYTGTVRDWELCSLGAAMANLMIAATALGLGTRWFGNPMLDAEPLKRLLGVPDEVEVVAVTPLGHHDEPRKKRPAQPLEALTGFERGDRRKLAALLKGRLPLAEVVHHNRFGAGLSWLNLREEQPGGGKR